MTGVLPSQTIENMLERGEITVSTPLVEGQVQPASLDLRLGTWPTGCGRRFWRARAAAFPTG